MKPSEDGREEGGGAVARGMARAGGQRFLRRGVEMFSRGDVTRRDTDGEAARIVSEKEETAGR